MMSAKKSVEYVNYSELKEFYTIPEVCDLLGLPKSELKALCQDLNIRPHKNEIGEHGLVKYDVRKLHNYLYHAADKDDDPWA